MHFDSSGENSLKYIGFVTRMVTPSKTTIYYMKCLLHTEEVCGIRVVSGY